MVSFPFQFEILPTHNLAASFGMVKYADNMYYCTNNQGHGLCVRGDMVILFFDLFHGKIYSPAHNPRT